MRAGHASNLVRRGRMEVVEPQFDRSGIELPHAVTSAPGMLSVAERRMLYGIVRDDYRGDGAIIDGGSFFGSSLAASAQGLRDSGLGLDRSVFPHGKPIHAYELGFLPKPPALKDPPVRQFKGVSYTLGDSFLPILQETIRPYDDLVELHIGDFNEKRWDGSPIEIAFIDVCKTPDLNAHVSAQFFPHLVRDAVVINQDFFFDRLPFIKVTMGYLADYFEWVGQVATSSIYIARRPISAEVANYDPFKARDPRCLEFHDRYAVSAADDETRLRMGISRAYLQAYMGEKDGALQAIERLRSDFSEVIRESRERMQKIDADRGGPPRDATLRLDRAVAEIKRR